MSADNIIYIKKESDNKWLVWETGFSNDDPQPPPHAKEFTDKDAALDYAFAEQEDHFIEYGIAPYDKVGKSIKEQNAELSQDNYCPDCNGWGTIFIEAGIPNVIASCVKCKGSGKITLD